MKCLDKKTIQDLDHRDRVRLINSISGVKSANLISTRSKEPQTNLSIISSLFHLGAEPPLFGFVIRPDSVTRDTLENLRANPRFTINHVNSDIIQQAHQTSARYEKNINEFVECGLTEEYLNNFEVPFVKESCLKFSADFIREIRIEENGTHLIIAQVIDLHLKEDILNEDYSLDITKFKSVGVSGLDTYLSLETIGRLSYAKPDKPLTWIDKNEVSK